MKKKLKVLLDAVIKTCNNNKFYGTRPLTKKHRTEIKQLASRSKTVYDLIPAFDFLFTVINDNHAHIRDFKTTKSLSGYRGKQRRSSQLDYKSVINQKFEFCRIGASTGYIKIVGIHPRDKKKEAKKIRKALIHLSNQNVSNWIIDLRYNTGGHFESMMTGVSPLLKEGTLARIVNRKGKTIGKAKLKKRIFSYFNMTTIKLPKKEKVKVNKIALLTSHFTTSSGELVAICFKGRKNTRFFGELTEGKTTNTAATFIKKKLILLLSTGYFADSRKNVYKKGIEPDVAIDFIQVSNKKEDPMITASLDWIKK